MFKKRNRKVLNVGGKLIECCTIKGLADTLGKSRDSIQRYEELGYFQAAPLRVGQYRYYPMSLALKLKEVVSKFPPNRPPKQELLVSINKIFNEEREILCQLAKKAPQKT